LVRQELTDAYPEFDEDGYELEYVDVKVVGVDVRFLEVVGVVPTHVLWEPCRVQVLNRDAPHVIQRGAVAPTA
jgi:hypothetical protein